MTLNKIQTLPQAERLLAMMPKVYVNLIQYLATLKAPMRMNIFYLAGHDTKATGKVETTAQMGVVMALTELGEMVPWNVILQGAEALDDV